MPLTPSWRTWRLMQCQTTTSTKSICTRYISVNPGQLDPFHQFSLTRKPWSRGYAVSSPSPAEDRYTLSKEVSERKQELDRYGIDSYPRYRYRKGKRSLLSAWRGLKNKSELADTSVAEQNDVVEVSGRITAIRLSGKKLAFIDISRGEFKAQIMLNQSALSDCTSESALRDQCRALRRGDFISVRGHPYVTKDGTASIKAAKLPQLLSPCLQRFPVQEHHSPRNDEEFQNLDRHIQMYTDPTVVSTLKIRSKIIRELRHKLESMKFLEVNTPILTALAGGASARPFETSATEFPNRKLSLRIAPELWLKRLVIGGLSRVFEIGPCFRNEGLDKTHNPEFTTCEFYIMEADLNRLMDMTQSLLSYVANCLVSDGFVVGMEKKVLNTVLEPGGARYNVIDFIPAINAALEVDLPCLESESARDEILAIFASKSILLPDKPTLPRLLDKLCSVYIEPQCRRPTWIKHIPECLSPLSKSFVHPTAPNAQPVAARAELFIQGREVVNCYEEENDPFKQRKKFVAQQQYARDPKNTNRVIDDEVMKIDEDYIRALEWGLPPTGGWGCGIDRLVMLFTDKEKIGDVLTFGNLRAVTRGAEKWDKRKKSNDISRL